MFFSNLYTIHYLPTSLAKQIITKHAHLQCIHCNYSILYLYYQDRLQSIHCFCGVHMTQKIRQDLNIGKNIRKFRNSLELSQEQVIARLQLDGIDMSRSIYSQIECGTYNIRVSELLALAKLFKVDINSFFYDI